MVTCIFFKSSSEKQSSSDFAKEAGRFTSSIGRRFGPPSVKTDERASATHIILVTITRNSECPALRTPLQRTQAIVMNQLATCAAPRAPTTEHPQNMSGISPTSTGNNPNIIRTSLQHHLAIYRESNEHQLNIFQKQSIVTASSLAPSIHNPWMMSG